MIRGTRERIAAELAKPRPEISEIALYAKPSRKMLFAMLNAFPNLKTIRIGSGLAKQSSRRQMDALSKSGIAVIIEKRARGRRSRFSAEQKKEIVREFRKDKKAAERHGITRRSVYGWMKK
jgi:hypothetical protein